MTKLASGEMKGQENVLVDSCWVSWIRVNQEGTWNIKLEKI